jgi:hypothetical protein
MLSTNAVALNLEDVFYGDQQRIPRTPAACVESGEKRRALKGAPRMTLVDITTYVIVYHYKLKSVQEIREDNDLLAEAIETLVHSDCKLGGYVIDSMVTSVESGYQMKGNSLFRASRLTIEARSQVLLPLPV